MHYAAASSRFLTRRARWSAWPPTPAVHAGPCWTPAAQTKARSPPTPAFPWPFGQSPFALGRGKAFEALVKEHGGSLLLAQLRQALGLPIEEVAYIALDSVADRIGQQARYRDTCSALWRAATRRPSPATLYDHPMLRLSVGGQYVYLEPDLVAFKVEDLFYVVEIKSFPVIDGRADGIQIAAATKQASTYVIALQDMFTDLNLDPALISTSVFLVTPKGFGNTPVATLIDARKEITMLRRQLQRMDRVADLLDLLPPGLSFDLAVVEDTPTRPPQELAA